MSAEPIKLGDLLRNAPTETLTHSNPVELKNIFADVQLSSGSLLRNRRYIKLLGGIFGLIALTGALAATLFIVARVAVPTASTTAAPDASAKAKANLPPAAAEFSPPVEELMRYLDDLRHGRVAFDPGLSGEEAAKQLGYSRLFASAYDEVALRARAPEQGEKAFSLAVAIGAFDSITREEQVIDKLLSARGRYAVSIAYLRALQNGDVNFPIPQAMAPTPPVLLAQLMSAYPDAHVDVRDPGFAEIYRKTRDLVLARATDQRRVWAQQIIADYRHLIVQSAGGQ